MINILKVETFIDLSDEGLKNKINEIEYKNIEEIFMNLHSYKNGYGRQITIIYWENSKV